MRADILLIVSSRDDANQALRLIKKLNNWAIIALSLNAEFYLKKKLGAYENPLYNFLDKKLAKKQYEKYYEKNFKIAYNWTDDEFLYFTRDRLGYFLTDFDRSVDFAFKVVKQLRPKSIFLPHFMDYKNLDIIYTSFESSAFAYVAKSSGIKYAMFKPGKKRASIKPYIGMTLEYLRFKLNVKTNTKCDLLFLASPKHLADSKRMQLSFSKAGLDVVNLTYDTTFQTRSRLRKVTEDFFEKKDFLDDDIRNNSIILLNSLKKKKLWRSFVHPKYKNNRIVMNFLRDKVKSVIEHEVGEIITDVLLARKIIYVTKPKVLVTITDPDRKTLSFVVTAKQQGIRTVSFQHGADFEEAFPYYLPEGEKVIAWSYLSKGWLSKNIDPNRILIGRSPFHKIDSPMNKRSSLKKTSVLFLSTVHFQQYSLVLFYQKKLFETLSKNAGDIKLTVRLHPFQNAEDIKALADYYVMKVEFEERRSLRESIENSDIVIFENTTAGLDAMYAGKPTVFFNPYNGRDYFEIGSRGISMDILSESQIEEDLPRFILDNQSWSLYEKRGRQFATKYLGLDRSDNLNSALLKKLIKASSVA